MRSRELISLASLLVFALPLSAASDSSQQAQPQAATPTIAVYPTETIEDIAVTDAQGNPVHGLRQSDFTVEEDGKPRAIRSFREFSSPLVSVQDLPKLPPNTYSNRQTASAGSALNILLLDPLNTSEPGMEGAAFALQTRVKRAAEQYLKSMPVGTRIAVLQLSFDLRIVQDFTSDPDLLSRAVDAMPIDLRPTAGGGGASITDDHGRVFSGEGDSVLADEGSRSTLEALKQIAASVASIRGKKNLIWITSGVAQIDDPTVNSIFYDGKLPDYLPDYHKTLALLKAAQVAIYPISASGVMAPRADGYDLYAAENLSLDSLAEATGGVAYYNTNDLQGALAKAVQAGADYYTLTYNPPDTKFDGRRHTITVHTNLPNVRLTYRDSYYAEDPRKVSPAPALAFAAAPPEPALSGEIPDSKATAGSASQKRMEAAFHTAMVRSMPTSAQLVFGVHVEPNVEPTQSSSSDPAAFGKLDRRYRGKLLARYAFHSSLDASQLALTTGYDLRSDLLYHGAVEFALAVFDGEGKQVTTLSQAVFIRLGDYGYKQLLEAPFGLMQQLDLPSGHFFVRVGILDRTSGKIGTLEFPVEIPNLLPIAISNPHDLRTAQPVQPTAQPSSQPPTSDSPALQHRPPT